MYFLCCSQQLFFKINVSRMLHKYSPIIFRQFLMKLINSSMKKLCLDFGISYGCIIFYRQQDSSGVMVLL